MGKTKKILWILLGISLLFCGCRANAESPEPAPPLRIVTQVSVTCRPTDGIGERHYTQSQKMEAILNYLRSLEYAGKAEVDPELLAGNAYQITVQLSDGSTQVYYQRADRYLSRNCAPWEKIDPEQATLLAPLLQDMQSDL